MDLDVRQWPFFYYHLFNSGPLVGNNSGSLVASLYSRSSQTRAFASFQTPDESDGGGGLSSALALLLGRNTFADIERLRYTGISNAPVRLFADNFI